MPHPPGEYYPAPHPLYGSTPPPRGSREDGLPPLPGSPLGEVPGPAPAMQAPTETPATFGQLWHGWRTNTPAMPTQRRVTPVDTARHYIQTMNSGGKEYEPLQQPAGSAYARLGNHAEARLRSHGDRSPTIGDLGRHVVSRVAGTRKPRDGEDTERVRRIQSEGVPPGDVSHQYPSYVEDPNQPGRVMPDIDPRTGEQRRAPFDYGWADKDGNRRRGLSPGRKALAWIGGVAVGLGILIGADAALNDLDATQWLYNTVVHEPPGP